MQHFSWTYLALFVALLLSTSESRQIVPIAPAVGKDVRVIGGNDVPLGYAPYQVSIQNTFGEHICGGSIIDQQWILTAAHCMEWPKQYLKIVTGTVNWTQPDGEYFVDEVKVHCLHDKPMYSNDVALLHLTKPIVFNANTRAVKLASSNTLKEGDSMVLTGWGSTRTWGPYPNLLQKVELKYVEHNKCSKLVKNASWLSIGQICSFTRSGEGTCHGDSGGPLVDANHVQVGIVNWGEACAVGFPDVYASVSYYHDWIMTTMAGTKVC